MPQITLNLKNKSGLVWKYQNNTSLGSALDMEGTEKLKLLVISQSRNPHYFKSMKKLSVKYQINKTAWMMSELSLSTKKKLGLGNEEFMTKKINIHSVSG